MQKYDLNTYFIYIQIRDKNIGHKRPSFKNQCSYRIEIRTQILREPKAGITPIGDKPTGIYA
jgi:hypothetical protein